MESATFAFCSTSSMVVFSATSAARAPCTPPSRILSIVRSVVVPVLALLDADEAGRRRLLALARVAGHLRPGAEQAREVARRRRGQHHVVGEGQAGVGGDQLVGS